MEKTEFKEKAKRKIDEIFAKIDDLEGKREKAKEEAKSTYDTIIADLKAKKKELQEKYEALDQAKDEKWAEAKKDFDTSAESFKKGFSKLLSLFE